MQEQSESKRTKRLDFFFHPALKRDRETNSDCECYLRQHSARWEWKTHFTNAIIMLCLHCVFDAPRPRGSQCERWARVGIHTHTQTTIVFFRSSTLESDRKKRARRYTVRLCACTSTGCWTTECHNNPMMSQAQMSGDIAMRYARLFNCFFFAFLPQVLLIERSPLIVDFTGKICIWFVWIMKIKMWKTNPTTPWPSHTGARR